MATQERYVVKEIVKFGMLFGYMVYDTKLNKRTCFDDYDEDEKFKAESRAELMNALNK